MAVPEGRNDRSPIPRFLEVSLQETGDLQIHKLPMEWVERSRTRITPPGVLFSHKSLSAESRRVVKQVR
jgi:hypothetical protein